MIVETQPSLLNHLYFKRGRLGTDKQISQIIVWWWISRARHIIYSYHKMNIMVAASACQLCWQYPGIGSESGLWVLLRQMWDNICIYWGGQNIFWPNQPKYWGSPPPGPPASYAYMQNNWEAKAAAIIDSCPCAQTTWNIEKQPYLPCL